MFPNGKRMAMLLVMKFSNSSEQQKREALTATFKDLITQRGFSYENLGNRMSWSRSYVSKIVNQQANLTFLDWVDLCSILKCTPKQFLQRVEKYYE